MLVIVDDPASSAPQSRATNSPASMTGSVSDTVNGEWRSCPCRLGGVLVPSQITAFSTFFKEEWSRAENIWSLIVLVACLSERENEKA